MSTDAFTAVVSVGIGLIIAGVLWPIGVRVGKWRRKVNDRAKVIAILSRHGFKYRSEYEGTAVIRFIRKRDYASALVILTTDRYYT